MDIVIDHTKCLRPETCGRCLNVCSPQVFALHPEEENTIHPQRWVIDPIWVGFCIQCRLCVEECPEQAITIV
jgi:formate hydrogenlyase subunit 6/NADH:ubiquinone oxidoreductase subunit I